VIYLQRATLDVIFLFAHEEAKVCMCCSRLLITAFTLQGWPETSAAVHFATDVTHITIFATDKLTV